MSDPVLETQRLTKRFGRKTALLDLTLELSRGGVHALVGRNGAGKSTLFRILLGFLHPSAGSSRLLGEDSQALSPATRGRIGFVDEEHTLPGWMTVGALAAASRALYPRWNEATFRDVASHFAVLEGAAGADARVAALSRGERAGLNLALALAPDPELLILDEPTLGLDVVAKQAFVESLLFAGEQSDRTVVYCSHQMDEVERLADHLVVVRHGKLAVSSAPVAFHSRVRGWLADSWPSDADPAEVPGFLQTRLLDGQRQWIVIDQDESFPEVLEDLGAAGAREVPVGFDRAVNAFLDTPGDDR